MVSVTDITERDTGGESDEAEAKIASSRSKKFIRKIGEFGSLINFGAITAEKIFCNQEIIS